MVDSITDFSAAHGDSYIYDDLNRLVGLSSTTDSTSLERHITTQSYNYVHHGAYTIAQANGLGGEAGAAARSRFNKSRLTRYS